MSKCGKPAVGKFHYIDSLGEQHSDEHRCTPHTNALLSSPEVPGTARSHEPPDPGARCDVEVTKKGEE